MTDTMIERVARAICLAELPSGACWEWCIPAARAAIRAMREPDEGMLMEGAATIRYFTAAQGPYPRTRAAYMAMIDAALTKG